MNDFELTTAQLLDYGRDLPNPELKKDWPKTDRS